ncbi:MAG: hydroxymethylglutaryl-CoA lyase [Silvibacterium sp.]|nr:hydroxymethylglutaryl-CoA lyase [Silvibacterium sp.]
MSEVVKLIECPRDAWQALAKTIPVEVKVEYLRALIDSGFEHIDAVSFVSAATVPQMADSEQVLNVLDPPDCVEIIGIVVNKKGADRAAASGRVTTLGFPYSISPTFLQRNQRQTPEESLEALDEIIEAAYDAVMGTAVYISMAFGNPYNDPWSIEEVIAACDLLTANGIKQISLADTTGIASPEQVNALVSEVLPRLPREVELGVHLHARPENSAAKVAAAYAAGCRRFDTALGGLGGCPFAQDVLVGNLPTEIAVSELKRLGAKLSQFRPLDSLLVETRSIATKFGSMT